MVCFMFYPTLESATKKMKKQGEEVEGEEEEEKEKEPEK